MCAAHSSETINKMREGFMTARVVLTAAELDLFSLLAHRPLTVNEVD